MKASTWRNTEKKSAHQMSEENKVARGDHVFVREWHYGKIRLRAMNAEELATCISVTLKGFVRRASAVAQAERVIREHHTNNVRDHEVFSSTFEYGSNKGRCFSITIRTYAEFI